MKMARDLICEDVIVTGISPRWVESANGDGGAAGEAAKERDVPEEKRPVHRAISRV